MTPGLTDAERVRIAEAEGYIPAPRKHYWRKDEVWWNRPNGGHACKFAQLPDYGGSLDAMHEAEKTLREGQALKYYELLSDSATHLVLSDDPTCAASFWTYHASALQRARAFLAVLDAKEGRKDE